MKLPEHIRRQFAEAGAKGGRIAAARMTPEARRDRALKAVAGRGRQGRDETEDGFPYCRLPVHRDFVGRLQRFGQARELELQDALELVIRAGLDILGE